MTFHPAFASRTLYIKSIEFYHGCYFLQIYYFLPKSAGISPQISAPSTARGDPAEAGAGAEDTPPPAHGEAGPAEGKERGGGGTGLHRHRRRRPGRPPGRSDKPLCRGLTFNRSQRGSCSATYETPTQKQVVYEWFSTRRPTNVRCVTGEGAAAFPAAPRVPGRRALRTGPRSQLAFCSILALLC